MKSLNDDDDMRQQDKLCDTISSLAISAGPESTGVTTFVQEACTAVSAVDSKFSSSVYPVQATIQDLREYFRRPVSIRSTTLGAGRGVNFSFNGTFKQYLDFWPNGVLRLTGVYGIRAKLVLTLQVSATPFHQGLIALSAQYGLPTTNNGCYDRTFDVCTTTNIPHVVLDLSNDTMVQLHLPYLYPAEYSDVRAINTDGEVIPYVKYSVNNLMPIPSVAGMGSPVYQVFLHLEDIEFFGATPNATSAIVLTAGRKLSPVTEEFETETHPYSSALSASSRAISFVAKGVPSLSSIGGPVAWALSKAAGVVRSFGYGKPTVTDPVMRVQRLDTIGEFNTDVASSLMVLAATATNSTAISTNVGCTDVDEMALSYITSRFSQICLFPLATTVSAGTLIYGTLINPLCYWFRNLGSVPAFNKPVPLVGAAAGNSVQPSHVMFAAASFKQWRGGLKFRFTFAKTKMHAGRVMVSFNPYYVTKSDTTFMDVANTALFPAYGSGGPDNFAYSAIFDLKDSNVFEFKIPFVCPVPYANLSALTGAMAMYVVDPLIASSVVSSTVYVLVEVAGDSDFELANPTGPMFPVHNQGTISTQSGRILSETPEVVNQHTMGEAITSVKQLISIPHSSTLGSNQGIPITSTIPPWYYTPNAPIAVPASSARPPSDSFSYGGVWASCYSFLKGGTDFHAYDIGATGTFLIYQQPAAGGFVTGDSAADNRSIAQVPMLVTTENSVHARLPAFFPTTKVYSWLANRLTVPGSSWWGTNPFTSVLPIDPYQVPQAIFTMYFQPDSADALSGNTILVNRNASDDAQLGMYIGPPPIYLPPSPLTLGKYDTFNIVGAY